ncbi:hypothetical protein NTHI1209_00287 [Haemophilus influenzae]|uniref:Uncharacterized protein n=1 Tax=Haemophilus influenzae TaxID=727 RepID=A0A158SUZ1_HAEIF|nr:hypothetical protein NTHI1209_00287 [Haemophilus influenzae]
MKLGYFFNLNQLTIQTFLMFWFSFFHNDEPCDHCT